MNSDRSNPTENVRCQSLVVEDDAYTRELLEEILRSRGHEVTVCPDAESAWDLCQKKIPNLILLDWMLPGMDGLELCRRFRSHAERQKVVIMMVTARNEPDDLNAVLDAGADDYLTKPLDVRLLGVRLGIAERRVGENRDRSKIEEQLRESEARHAAARGANDGLWDWNLETGVVDFSPRWKKMLGYLEKEIGSSPDEWFRRIHPDDLPNVRQALDDHLAGRSPQFESEHRLIARDGSYRWMLGRAQAVIVGNEKPLRIAGSQIDVTERRLTETALRESEERYALASRGANDGLFDWDLRSQRNYLSPRWKSVIGFEESEIGDGVEEWLSRVHADDRPRLDKDIETHLSGESDHFENEHRIRHKDGADRWVLARGLAVRDEQARAIRMAGSLTDITDRKAAEQRLIHDAFHDALTGLPNRALFADRLLVTIERRKRHPEHFFAVLFLDVDRFKIVNDSLGHMLGDRFLVEISKRILTCVRAIDTVARIGGDEFTILLEEIGEIGGAIRVADRIQKSLLTPIDLEGQETFATVSIGIATSTGKYENPEDLLRDADTAMYRAKALGRARFEVFEQTMNNTGALRLLKLETELRRALERDELRAYYQPTVDLASGRISGFEALLRWQHPQRGLLTPDQFLPLAEETGLIEPLGQWILREACRQTLEWRSQLEACRDLSISVNLSGNQFRDAGLAAHVESIVKDSGLPASSVILEITESIVMGDIDASIFVIRCLQSIGVQFQIDDFGTGYSSFSYLQRLPVDGLKIDRSFITGMEHSADDLEIVRTIVSLARKLELTTTAEGVENSEQLQHLRGHGCEMGQGYFFSRPVDRETATTMLSAGKRW